MNQNTVDDLIANPLLPEGNPIPTPYDGLAYPNFHSRADNISIVKAHSPNNTAAHSPSSSDLLTSTVGMITATYTGSKVEYFDLDSTYLGCTVQSEVSVGVPEPCMVQFNGTKTNGKVFSENCTYEGTALNPALVKCTFSALKSVKSVNVTVVEAATLDLTMELLDNVMGVLYSFS